MKVFEIQQDASSEEIAGTLAKEFSSIYSYRLFGIGDNKSVIVRKSEFVGAQISKSGNLITVHAIAPNLLFNSLDALLTGLVGAVSYAQLMKLERDLVIFLKTKYSI